MFDSRANNPALQVKSLSTIFHTEYGLVKAVNKASFEVEGGQTLGLVGESGCGKSVTARSVMRLLESSGEIVSGEVWLAGKNLMQMSRRELEEVRGRDLAMVFQDPLASLNPVLSIGSQMIETLKAHQNISTRSARKKALEQLTQVGLPDPERILRSYSFELSGGMCQRVIIAMAIMLKPKVLIVDEPTTALDPTVQVQILAELKRLQVAMNMAMVLITHDLGVVASIADQVAVMYAGSIVETASVNDLFSKPAHPYTRALLNSIPRFGQQTLTPIEGQPPSLLDLPAFCPFYARCPEADSSCRNYSPTLQEVAPDHHAACRSINASSLMEVLNQ